MGYLTSRASQHTYTLPAITEQMQFTPPVLLYLIKTDPFLFFLILEFYLLSVSPFLRYFFDCTQLGLP